MRGCLSRWIYFKLYLGNAIDRMDRLIVELGQAVPQLQGVESWFYIRYFDEEGEHVRLRVKSAPDCCEPLRRELTDLCTRYLGGLHSIAPSGYYPMVTAPGFKETVERLTGGHNDVRLVKAIYEPEYDKFGGENGMPIAERLFQASSEIACGILIDEFRNLYSRKDMFPELMDAAFRAFAPGDDEQAFWREYGFYWLSGKSLAAEDWRKKFFEKGRELAAQGVPVLPGQSGLSWEAYEHLRRYEDALALAVREYQPLLNNGDAKREVLCFNFMHLMNNRLGLSALEEAYMSALLEQQAA